MTDGLNEDEKIPHADAPAETPAEKKPAAKKPAAKKAASKAKATLDKSKPYATIHGGLTKARFLQDEQYFDVSGKPCEF